MQAVSDSKQYQYPNIFRQVENGYASVRTWKGAIQHGNTLRVSPRIADETKVTVLDKMEADLRKLVETL